MTVVSPQETSAGPLLPGRPADFGAALLGEQLHAGTPAGAAPFLPDHDVVATAVHGTSVSAAPGAFSAAAHATCPGFRRISGPLLGMCLRCANFGDSPAAPPAVAFRSGVPDCPAFQPATQQHALGR